MICCGVPECPYEAPEVVAADKLVRDWMEEYGVEIDYGDAWALVALIVGHVAEQVTQHQEVKP